MPMNRASYPADLEPGLNAHFGMAYRQYQEEWRQVFEVENSQKAFEEDVLEYGFGGAVVKPEGGAITFDEGGQSWKARYDHDTIALGFQITQEALEDNLYQSLGPKLAKGLARALMHTREIKHAAIFNNATTSGYTGGDGQTLLSTTHPTALAGNQSNRLAVAAQLSEASIEDVMIMIRKAKDDRGIPVALRSMNLVIPPDLMYEANRILRSPLRSGTTDNDVNALKNLGVLQKDPVVITRLSSTTAWFITTDAPQGLIHFNRIPVQRGMQEDFLTGNAQYKVRERYSQGWSDWRSCYGSEGA